MNKRELRKILGSRTKEFIEELYKEITPLVKDDSQESVRMTNSVEFTPASFSSVFGALCERLFRMTLDMANKPMMITFMNDSVIYTYVSDKGKYKMGTKSAKELFLPSQEFFKKYPDRVKRNIVCTDPEYLKLNKIING